MLEKFKNHIENNFPELKGNHFLIACSGGLDSMVLTELCRQAELKFSLAHCNFRLRGKESDGDEDFVRQYAKGYNIPFYVTHFDTIGYVNQHKVSVQMAARDLRYNWFARLQQQENMPYLLTAHHADDNLETFLINLSRGTGIDGLIGIPPKTAQVRRPLLPFSKEEIEVFAKSINLTWREDASNMDVKYQRNKIRIEVIPRLKELHPRFLSNFQNTLEYLGQTQALTHNYLENLKKELFIPEKGSFKISLESLMNVTSLESILYGLFNTYGFTEWQNLKDLLQGMSGKRLLSNTHVLLKDREFLWLSPLDKLNKGTENFLIHGYEDSLDIPFAFTSTQVAERRDNGANEIFVQKDTLKYPLVLRKWQKGDYFYPLGLNRKKKLSKFFKDEKMNILEKNEQWLLCSDNEIVWVVGRRADHRFRVSDPNKGVLKFKIT